MCGVWAVYSEKLKEDHVANLMLIANESKIRGLHSFGFTTSKGTRKFHNFREMIYALKDIDFKGAKWIFGHNRYSTSGDWLSHKNNQPINKADISLAFNGVISMKTKADMEKEYNLKMETYNDGEIFIHQILRDRVEQFLISNKGSFSGVWSVGRNLFVARNDRRPLNFTCHDGAVYIASTYDILKRSLGLTSLELKPGKVFSVQQLVI